MRERYFNCEAATEEENGKEIVFMLEDGYAEWKSLVDKEIMKVNHVCNELRTKYDLSPNFMKEHSCFDCQIWRTCLPWISSIPNAHELDDNGYKIQSVPKE